MTSQPDRETRDLEQINAELVAARSKRDRARALSRSCAGIANDIRAIADDELVDDETAGVLEFLARSFVVESESIVRVEEGIRWEQELLRREKDELREVTGGGKEGDER